MDGSEPSSEVADGGRQGDRRRPAAAPWRWPATSARWPAAGRSSQAAIDSWGRIDGVVCVAGILRERMLFNMGEDEFDDVVRVHLKGTFTVYRAASAVMRKQEGGGSLIGFTSGVWALGSTAQANYAAAKGGIVSLTTRPRSGCERYGVTGQLHRPRRPHADVGQRADAARRERRAGGRGPDGGLPASATRPGTSPARCTRRRRQDRRVEPADARSAPCTRTGGGRPEEIAARLDGTVGIEKMPFLAKVEEMRAAAAAGDKPNS